ncbi:hypothetical protein cand_013170 [Cryptosporidium andersoni]|uniref:Uncharacterized protein n=1 Tax=Cryptosporidium andersoni TaxID=117008 RepID=A0A1J4MET5_9CRYT|nr:hypothetical protein cand_013170 [Cryptosporidium andersoni]
MNASLLFLGTGTKEGTPNLGHTIKNIEYEHLNKGEYCSVCSKCIETLIRANKTSVEYNKNIRNSYSALLSIKSNKNSEVTILFEISVEVRKSIIQCASKFLKKVDIILTMHSTEESIGGIDEVREIQNFEHFIDENGNVSYYPKKPIPLYLSTSAFINLSNWYNYMILYSLKIKPPFKTKVGTMNISVFDPHNPGVTTTFKSINEANKYVEIHRYTNFEDNLDFSPVPFKYDSINITALYFKGNNNELNMGYVIQDEISKNPILCILPNFSIIPQKTLQYLINLPCIQILVVPLLQSHIKSEGTYNIPELIKFCLKISCRNVYLTSITCGIDHTLLSDYIRDQVLSLSKYNVNIPQFHVAYDSLFLKV